MWLISQLSTVPSQTRTKYTLYQNCRFDIAEDKQELGKLPNIQTLILHFYIASSNIPIANQQKWRIGVAGERDFFHLLLSLQIVLGRIDAILDKA